MKYFANSTMGPQLAPQGRVDEDDPEVLEGGDDSPNS
jgi:hypothetical protein